MNYRMFFLLALIVSSPHAYALEAEIALSNSSDLEDFILLQEAPQQEPFQLPISRTPSDDGLQVSEDSLNINYGSTESALSIGSGWDHSMYSDSYRRIIKEDLLEIGRNVQSVHSELGTLRADVESLKTEMLVKLDSLVKILEESQQIQPSTRQRLSFNKFKKGASDAMGNIGQAAHSVADALERSITRIRTSRNKVDASSSQKDVVEEVDLHDMVEEYQAILSMML